MPEEQIIQLEKRVLELEKFIRFIHSDRYIFQKHLQMFDANDILFGGVKGTRIGTTTKQKFAFHGATPVIQRTNASQAAVDTTGAITGVGAYGYSQSQANAIITLLNEIRAALVEKGVIKGS